MSKLSKIWDEAVGGGNPVWRDVAVRMYQEAEKLEAEAERWKSLADLKDAKGEANRTLNNKLNQEIAILKKELEASHKTDLEEFKNDPIIKKALEDFKAEIPQ